MNGFVELKVCELVAKSLQKSDGIHRKINRINNYMELEKL